MDGPEDRNTTRTEAAPVTRGASGREQYDLPRPRHPNGNPHGRASSWAVVVVAIAALTAGAVAFVLHAWIAVWVCAVIAVLCFPAGLAVRIMDDTVMWAAPTPGDVQRGEIIRAAGRIHAREQEARAADPAHRDS